MVKITTKVTYPVLMQQNVVQSTASTLPPPTHVLLMDKTGLHNPEFNTSANNATAVKCLSCNSD